VLSPTPNDFSVDSDPIQGDNISVGGADQFYQQV
jgi:hypothetical protein